MADNNRPATLPSPLDVATAQKYICPPKGCAAGEFLNGGNRFKPVPTKDVWQQNERERASSNILQIPIAPSLTQQTQTKINRGE
jgi:hypothetical protein